MIATRPSSAMAEWIFSKNSYNTSNSWLISIRNALIYLWQDFFTSLFLSFSEINFKASLIIYWSWLVVVMPVPFFDYVNNGTIDFWGMRIVRNWKSLFAWPLKFPGYNLSAQTLLCPQQFDGISISSIQVPLWV